MKKKIVCFSLLCLLTPIVSFGQTAASGYAVTTFASGFTVSTIFPIGPTGIASDAMGNVYVANVLSGFVYKFGPGGGIASPATQLATPSTLGGHLAHGLAFGKDGNLYAALLDAGSVVQLDPVAGTIIRTVATGIPSPTALATDPLSGDLFVDQASASVNPNNIYRVSLSGTTSPPPVYATVPHADGLAFAPDGTLYVAAVDLNGVVKVSGTNSPPPTPSTWTLIANVPFIDGMAISAIAGTPVVYGNRNDGTITKIDLTTSPPTLTDIVTGGTRGDFATVGSDGCLYATQTASVLKVTNADGTCLPPPLGPLFPASAPTPVFVDIKPQSCPNPINVGAHGTLPVAILGTATFDVTTIDPTSVRLEGVPAARFAFEDTATPFIGELTSATSCTTAGRDGFTDLVLSFGNPAVAAALGTTTNGQVLLLRLTGNLLPQFGRTAISGQDVIVINK